MPGRDCGPFVPIARILRIRINRVGRLAHASDDGPMPRLNARAGFITMPAAWRIGRVYWGNRHGCQSSEISPAQADGRHADASAARLARFVAVEPARRTGRTRRSIRLLYACAGNRRTDPATRGFLPIQDAAV